MIDEAWYRSANSEITKVFKRANKALTSALKLLTLDHESARAINRAKAQKVIDEWKTGLKVKPKKKKKLQKRKK